MRTCGTAGLTRGRHRHRRRLSRDTAGLGMGFDVVRGLARKDGRGG